MDGKTVTISDEDAALLDAYVESGEYTSREEAVRDAILGLKAHRETSELFEILDEADTERWLREEVEPTIDRIEAGEPTLSVEEVRASLREHALARRSKSA